MLNLKGLNYITIHNSGLVEIPNMQGYNLCSVNLSDNRGFDTLKRLPLAHVVSLDISDTATTTLDPLERCARLEILNCRNNQISNISALRNLTELTELDLSGCNITEVVDPFNCLYLKKLNMSNNTLTDVSGFSDVTILQTLDLSGNNITDIPWLGKNVATLTDISLSGNPIDAEKLSCVKNCKQLRTLQLDGIALGNLSICSYMSKLIHLSANNCGIKDISSLMVCQKLEILDLSFNDISDISALAVVEFPYQFSVLNLANNKITDVSPIYGKFIGSVALQCNPFSLNTESFDDLHCRVLALDYFEGLEISSIRNSNIDDIYLVGCPNDKRVLFEDAFGSKVQFVTRDEQLEMLERVWRR